MSSGGGSNLSLKFILQVVDSASPALGKVRTLLDGLTGSAGKVAGGTQKTSGAIHLLLQQLIVSLRTTATVLVGWKLDKYQTSNDDILNAFRLAYCNYELPDQMML
jgi:hypothetical protein